MKLQAFIVNNGIINYKVMISGFFRVLFICSLILSSCHTQKPIENTAQTENVKIHEDTRIVMNRGGCFGTCPVYSLIIEFPGNASYVGKMFTDKSGLHQKQLTDSLFRALVSKFEDADLWQFQDVYDSDLVDLAEIEIIYERNGESKSVKGRNNRPEVVHQLEKELVKIAESEGWQRILDNETEAVDDKSAIIIQTKEKLVLTKWIRKYADYRLMFKNRLQDNKWLVSWDEEKISAAELLEVLQNDPEIIKAYFKKQNN